MTRRILVLALSGVVLVAANGITCTDIVVGKQASVDGSVITSHTGAAPDCRVHVVPAQDHEAGSMAPVYWGLQDAKVPFKAYGEVIGHIPQVEHTYRYFHSAYSHINEHQLAIAESTFVGREELINPDGLLHYWNLMRLALQRARTAREALDVITDLVAKHGYRSEGESISIADPNEVWLLEIIGTGPGGEGAIWVAQRIPDGMVSCHANKARIGEFPLDDPDNCRYSPNVISFAVEKGYYDPGSGQPLNGNQT